MFGTFYIVLIVFQPSPYLDHIIVLFTEKYHKIELTSTSKIWVNFITSILCPTKLDIVGTPLKCTFCNFRLSSASYISLSNPNCSF